MIAFVKRFVRAWREAANPPFRPSQYELAEHRSVARMLARERKYEDGQDRLRDANRLLELWVAGYAPDRSPRALDADAARSMVDELAVVLGVELNSYERSYIREKILAELDAPALA